MSYQPFLISEFKTGLYQYLEPWMRPVDAFQPLEDAYVFRGTLNKRSGYAEFGRLVYRNNGVTLAVGNGGSVYSGTLASFPIRTGTMSVKATTSGGLETFTDNGSGVLTGSLLGTGTINYTTGAWALNFGANTVANPVIIAGSYTYIPSQLTTPVVRPIMGIKQFINETTNVRSLVCMDTRRASLFNTTTNRFDPISSVSQTLWVGDGATTNIVLQTGWANVARYTVTISDSVNTMTDNGVGGFAGAGNMTNLTTVNYTTGAITLDITAANTRTYTVTLSLQGDYFTGTNSNFFNSTNWLSEMYMTNNVDRVTLFDGTNLSRPPLPITTAHNVTYTNDITTCIDVKVYKNRLLLLRPTIVGTATPAAQSIRYSATNNPTNFIADISGNGGEISAPTADWLQGAEFLRDVLIVGFEFSTWTFRFTGVEFDPFRWDKINNSRTNNCPYAFVGYDERVTSIGTRGFIACDGVNVQRYDEKVIDLFLDIDQQNLKQCFAQKFDTLNQTWMCYPSSSETLSNQISVYNYLEDTWSTYNIPMSCLGLFYVTSDKTWADFPNTTWEQADFSWDSYLLQEAAPTLLGGDQNGIVYQMNYTDLDVDAAITPTITSSKWNPFIQLGRSTQFGYIDIYYEIVAEPTVDLDISFFAGNSTTASATRTVTLDGPVNSDAQWKRCYINVVGQFVKMSITSSSEGLFKILGMILWADEGGRINQ